MEDQWEDILENVHTASVCVRHGLKQFKVLHALFSVPGDDSPLSGANYKIATFIMLLARRLVLLNCKNPQPHILWLRDVIKHLELEKLRANSQRMDCGCRYIAPHLRPLFAPS